MHAPQEELQRVAKHLMEVAVEHAGRQGCKQVTTEIVSGDPAERILHAAEEIEADAIVMGSRGLGDLSGILKGSVSHKVNYLSRCTCITVT
jgi:nucleotide-binding universal stress UspA family protein